MGLRGGEWLVLWMTIEIPKPLKENTEDAGVGAGGVATYNSPQPLVLKLTCSHTNTHMKQLRVNPLRCRGY